LENGECGRIFAIEPGSRIIHHNGVLTIGSTYGGYGIFVRFTVQNVDMTNGQESIKADIELINPNSVVASTVGAVMRPQNVLSNKLASVSGLRNTNYGNPVAGKWVESAHTNPTIWDLVRLRLMGSLRVGLSLLVGLVILYVFARICSRLPLKAKSDKYRRALRHIYWMLVVLGVILYAVFALAVITKVLGSGTPEPGL